MSGMPYISVNSATRNAATAPIDCQSRPVRGWKKLAVNTTAVNFALRSDFRWILLTVCGLSAAAAAAIGLSWITS